MGGNGPIQFVSGSTNHARREPGRSRARPVTLLHCSIRTPRIRTTSAAGLQDLATCLTLGSEDDRPAEVLAAELADTAPEQDEGDGSTPAPGTARQDDLRASITS